MSLLHKPRPLPLPRKTSQVEVLAVEVQFALGENASGYSALIENGVALIGESFIVRKNVKAQHQIFRLILTFEKQNILRNLISEEKNKKI